MDITLEAAQPVNDIEAVYRAHAPRLWRSLLAWTGDAAIADDAVAEAFAQALRRGEALREPERWVWRTAYRIAAGALKERGRHGGTAPDVSYQLDEVPASLAEALAMLPPGQRAAVVLHYYADLRVRDVAQVLGTSSAAVKVSLMRARRRLRIVLEDPDG
jgi:RNA polymerase sigma-70 factor (ECF subfamily)